MLFFVAFLLFAETILVLPLTQHIHVALRASVVAVTDLLGGYGASLLTAVMGALLYAFRQRFRMGYGVCEVAVGSLGGAVTLLLMFRRDLLDERFLQSLSGAMPPAFLHYLALATSVYVVVRGLDNFGGALREPDARKLWEGVFGKGS